MLHAFADMDEQIQPLADREPLAIAIAGDGLASNVFHDEIRTAQICGARVEHPRDRGVVHERQGLALRLEAGDDLCGVKAGFDDLEGDVAADRPLLLRQPDLAHSPFANAFE
jgi:hypothetical protein